jgi:DNA-binding CsgD family transcriptional regulator
MGEAEQISELIGGIYDGVLDPALWPNALEQTCDYVQGVASVLISHDATTRIGNFHFSWGDDPAYTESYNRTFSAINPLIVPAQMVTSVGDVVAVADLIPYDEYVASRFYKEWAAPQGYLDTLLATLEKSAHALASLNVARHQRQGWVDEQARARMRLLAPHFRRAVAISRIVDLNRIEAATLARVCDELSDGVILVAADARIVYANKRGYLMMEDGTVLRASGGRLAAVDPQADAAFRDLFAVAGDGDVDSDLAVGAKGIAIPLARHDDHRFIAHVLPLTRGARRRAGVSYGAVAAVFVRETAIDLPSAIETFAELYKLTPGELRVAVAIVGLGGVPDVAAVLGISETTVRTHLQRVFEKTGTNRQADLVKLAAEHMGPFSQQ